MPLTSSFTPDGYHQLLCTFLRHGYKFASFLDFNGSVPQKDVCILRHDVDADPSAALQLSQIENSLGIQSTYFFLVSSEAYNLATSSSRTSIKSLRRDGHTIGLHLSNPETDFNVFAAITGHPADVVSLHTLDVDFSLNAQVKGAARSAYDDRFFNNIVYRSDSEGRWRHGNPTEESWFERGLSCQILIHPMWWAHSPLCTTAKESLALVRDTRTRRLHAAIHAILPE